MTMPMFMLWQEVLTDTSEKSNRCDMWHARRSMECGKTHRPRTRVVDGSNKAWDIY